MVMAAATRTRLLLALVAVVALAGVRAQQSDLSESPPTESQCRPYIEKALKEFGTSEQTPGGKEEDVDQPTTTDKYTQPLGHETMSPDEESSEDQIINEDYNKEHVTQDASSEDLASKEEGSNSEEAHGDESEVTEDASIQEEVSNEQEQNIDSSASTEDGTATTSERTDSTEEGTISTEEGTTVTTVEGISSIEEDTIGSQDGKGDSEEDAISIEDSTTRIEQGAVSTEEGTSAESAEESAASAEEAIASAEGAASVEEGAASAEEGAASAEEGAASAEEGAASAEEGAASAEEGAASAEEGAASAEEGAASAEEGAASAEEGAASAEEGAASAEEGAASAEEGAASAEEGAASAEEGAASAEEGAASAEEGAASAEEGAASAEEGAASAEEGAASAEEGAASAEEGAASAEEGAASAEEGAASAEEGAASAEEGVASAEEGEASAEEGEASTEEGEASTEEGAASAEGGTVNIEQGAKSDEGAASDEGTASTEERAASTEERAASTEESIASAEESVISDASAEEKTSKEDGPPEEESAKSAVSAESKDGSRSAEVGEQEIEDASNITSAEQVADEVASVSEEKESEGEAESQEAVETTPEEELTQELIIPENLRPRDHIAQILHLDQESIEKELLLSKTVEITLKELKRLYDTAIKPLELLYKYRDLSNRHFGDPEIFSKPLILFMGPWSGGKSSIINYLLDNEYAVTALRTGAEPSPAYFNILMWGDHPEVIDGTQLAADWTFSGLQKFGQGLLDRLRGLRLPNRLLEKVNIVEIPGILEIRKQVERLFPFNDACQWFIDRADIIFLVYDPAKLDVGPETEAILDQLKGRESQTRIVLNKADQVRPEELMRVQGTLIWNISPLMSSTEPPVMYSTSLWSLPYEMGAPIRLLQAQERAFLRDMRTAIDRRVENKIASARRFAVRVRNHAKMVDCYLTTYYNHKGIFGNRKRVSDDIIERPQDYHIYEGLSTLTNISRYDLPDPDVYKDFFRLNPLYEFPLLSSTCTYFRGCPINRLDIAIAYDLPELIGKYRKGAEEALASKS